MKSNKMIRKKTMKKTILKLLMAAMSTGPKAESVGVGQVDTFNGYFYPSTIRNNGKIAKIWSMQDMES